MNERKITADFKRVKIEDAVKPKEGLTVTYLNRYWNVTSDNEILFYRGQSPQCHSNEEIAKSLKYEGCTLQFIPAVFVKARSEDWNIRI